MTCAFAGAFEISLLTSGIRIRPYEVNTQSGMDRYSHVRAKISREAGALIADSHEHLEPALLIVSGEPMARFYVDPDCVKMGHDSASLTLYDAIKVLNKGTIQKHFTNQSVDDMVEYIIERKDDPNDVITEIVKPDDELGGAFDPFGDIPVASFLADGALFAAGIDKQTSLKFDEESPLSALNKIAETFEISMWVDVDGKFHYTFEAAVPESYLTIDDRQEEFRLAGYNVTTASGTISRIRVSAPLYEERMSTNPAVTRGATTLKDTGDTARADAWLPNTDGRAVEADLNKQVVGLEGLEDAALRRLVKEYMNRNSGNIVLNAMASPAKEKLARVRAGDYVKVDKDVEKHCERAVESGVFVINSVQHVIDDRRGWQTTLEVAGLPEEPQAKSWIYDPEDDVIYDDLNDWEDNA